MECRDISPAHLRIASPDSSHVNSADGHHCVSVGVGQSSTGTAAKTQRLHATRTPKKAENVEERGRIQQLRTPIGKLICTIAAENPPAPAHSPEFIDATLSNGLRSGLDEPDGGGYWRSIASFPVRLWPSHPVPGDSEWKKVWANPSIGAGPTEPDSRGCGGTLALDSSSARCSNSFPVGGMQRGRSDGKTTVTAPGRDSAASTFDGPIEVLRIELRGRKASAMLVQAGRLVGSPLVLCFAIRNNERGFPIAGPRVSVRDVAVNRDGR